MTEKDYYNLTKEFIDISVLLKEQKTIKTKLNRVLRKLNTLDSKYSFIKEIIGVNVDGEKLENSIKKYFKEIGFKDVRKVGNSFGKDDIQIYLDNELIISEATGIKGIHTKDSKTRQITKHLELKRNNGEKVFGIFIVNHDKETYYTERNTNPFSKDQINYAIVGKYSLVTTLELLRGFIKVKTNELTLEQYKVKLCSFGMVEF